MDDFINGDNDELTLWYRKPARLWEEALPLGNGRIGAMVYGNTDRETIDLSEITCFSGEAGDGEPPSDAAEHFYKARESLLRGDYAGAKVQINKYLGKRQNYGTNLPLGHLNIEFLNNMGNITSYKRSLLLEKAVARVNFASDGNAVEYSAFVSHPRQILVVRIVSLGGKKLDLNISMDGADNAGRLTFGSNGDLLLRGSAFETMHSDGKTGVTFHGRLRVCASDACIEDNGGKIRLSNASEALILFAVHTDYEDKNPKDLCAAEIERASALTCDELLKEHSEDFSSLFSRVKLSIGKKTINGIPTDEQIENVKKGGDTCHLSELLFQYGRYLLISSSRADSPLPAHLQGVFNDSVASRIGWTCDMHLDINTQMNYWPAEVTNLSECHRPLFEWVEKKLVPSGSRTADKYYGLNGWVAEVVSNAWGYTAPYWHYNLSPCPTGGVWIATHFWEHYLFTGDTDFLREKGLPVITGAVRFFVDYIFEDPRTGKLGSGPSVSPENIFAADGEEFASSLSPTYEIVMIREIFNIYLNMCGVLDISGELLDSVKEKLECLPVFEIGPQGELKEWQHNFEAKDPQHRHTSHLLSLFPFGQITPEKTPELAKAVKKSLELRTKPEKNWEDTGWSRSLLLLYAARLLDSKAAFEHISSMLTKLTAGNLMIQHPPTRGAPSFANVYELDGNTGLTAGIAEMLLQSHENRINLLPALPEQWAKGTVCGLCARGGFVVDMEWNNRKLTEAVIHSRFSVNCSLKYGNKAAEFFAEKGHSYLLNTDFKITQISRSAK